MPFSQWPYCLLPFSLFTFMMLMLSGHHEFVNEILHIVQYASLVEKIVNENLTKAHQFVRFTSHVSRDMSQTLSIAQIVFRIIHILAQLFVYTQKYFNALLFIIVDHCSPFQSQSGYGFSCGVNVPKSLSMLNILFAFSMQSKEKLMLIFSMSFLRLISIDLNVSQKQTSRNRNKTVFYFDPILRVMHL